MNPPKPKNSPPPLLIILIALSVTVGVGYKSLGWEKNINNFIHIPAFAESQKASSTVEVLPPIEEMGVEAWRVFAQYIVYAHAHNIEGVKQLSYQLSPTCSDEAKVKECNVLMDNLVNIASMLNPKLFTHILADDKQIMLYTDAPTVVMLYFTREGGVTKVLGMRFCLEQPEVKSPCIDKDKILVDTNGNGWWDTVEAMFYKK